ncbi:Phage terminase large subunit [compost metagenome]
MFAVAGRPGREKHIKDGVAKVDIDWRGRVKRNGVQLWHVGTNHAKDLIYNRLHIPRPGPGYMHFSHELSDEFFRQMAGEQRTTKMTARGEESKWTATRKRVEAWDCTVYAVWLETHLDLARNAAKYWDQLEQRLRSQPAGSPVRAATPSMTATPVAPRPPARRTSIASDDWSSRL